MFTIPNLIAVLVVLISLGILLFGPRGRRLPRGVHERKIDDSNIQRTVSITLLVNKLQFEKQAAVLHLREGEYVDVVGPEGAYMFVLEYNELTQTDEYILNLLDQASQLVGGAVEYRLVQ